MGACQSRRCLRARLEPYAKNWPTNAPDRCKPGTAALPISRSARASYYLPLTKGQVLQAEAGPQGGHHIWIATRMKNMKQAGSTTRIVGVQPGTGDDPPDHARVHLRAGRRGFCKLYGIRYQLDADGIDYKQFLGKPLDVR